MGAADVRHSGSLILALVACHGSSGPPAPPIVATAELGEAALIGGYQVGLAPDGGLVALTEDHVVGVGVDGKQRWSVALHHHGWMLWLDSGSVLVSDDHDDALHLLDAITGAERIPKTALPPGTTPDDEVSVEAAVATSDVQILAMSDGRFLQMGMAKPAEIFALDNEFLADPALVALPGGDLLLIESDTMRRLTLHGDVRATIRAWDVIGGVTPLAGGKVAATIDDELVIYDLGACGATPVRLPKRDGHLYVSDEEDSACDACTAPPPGCVIAHGRLDGDVDEQPPLALPDGSMIVTWDDGVARIGADGSVVWTSEVAGFGPMQATADTLFVLASTVGDDLEAAPVRVTAIDLANGHTRWTRELPATAGVIVDFGKATLALASPWLVAGYGGKLAWLKLP